MDSLEQLRLVARSTAMTMVCSLVTAQGMFDWVPLWSSGPSPRRDHAMSYGGPTRGVLLFGGLSDNYLILNDTWRWTGNSWAALNPSTSPPGRLASAIAYDSFRDRVVLFGGQAGPAGGFSDTWEWDGSNWQQITTTSQPTARSAHAMSYDAARQRVLLYGGTDGTASNSASTETWQWDGVNWLQRFPASSAGNMSGHCMTYDSARQRVIAIHSPNTSQSLRVAEWDGNNWIQSPSTTQLLRAYASFVPGRNTTVAFGIGSTWEWDGATWRTVPTPNIPSHRDYPALVNVPGDNYSLMFGGSTQYQWPGETWKLQYFPAATATATTFGTGCGAPQLNIQGDPQSRPILGQIARANITNVPSTLVAMSIGASRTFMFPIGLPFELTSVGMPGCYLLQSNDIANLGTIPGAGGTATFEAFLPTLPSLLGQHIYMQAYSLAPGYNQLGFVASNGLDWVLGDH